MGLSVKKRAAVGGVLVYSFCKRRVHCTFSSSILFLILLYDLNPNLSVQNKDPNKRFLCPVQLNFARLHNLVPGVGFCKIGGSANFCRHFLLSR